ncbi:NAD-dependent succinate-semialdehyde dehydrogenase [Marinivivus vitaminiproducens]|uniref:NAD-dependent succinate-semialdehyde dehydrogenase n=1 Tax=Marinivivus vitaminiproducens TaxID=3035935 RepID=UPI00279E5104|nr:NAD-dependent succinate-semialdehyde dehydrogenase [Geminicoccaceae bacterium SCSIO 64248]
MRLFREAAYLDGAWVGSDTGKSLSVTNPATGDAIGQVPDLAEAETERAIAAAARAFETWRATPAKARAQILRRWYDLIMANQEDLAVLMTTEQGKPLTESRGEVAYGASFIDWFAEEGRRTYGEVIPAPAGSKRIVTLRQPVGVVAAITPWNFPIAMITRKVGPALAAGCTVVARPASQTPYCALALAELAERAGLPKGVLNVLTGSSKAIGGALTASKTVRKLTFTGSTEVGRLLIKQCADTVKKVTMELGGHAPFIVFDDADIDAAVAGAMASKFRNMGQTCVCANRIYVHEAVYDAFLDKLNAKVKALKVAPGLEEGSEQGALIAPSAVEKVEEHVADATAKGAVVTTGGARHALGGTFYQPTVLSGCTHDMLVAQEETFGPVAALFRFSDEAEVLRQANRSEFGLAGYFYSRDVARIFRVAEALEVGIIGINDGIISTAEAPFGGVKQSGIGREGGPEGIDDYLEVKYLAFGNMG